MTGKVSFSVDLAKLLTPISPESPNGVSLRYEGTYDRIREARRADDATLEQGIWKAEQKRANWDEVKDLCLGALETQTKDLQIACWLLEAWLHLYSFAGIREGLQVCLALCETFWENLYPGLDAEDPEERVAPIDWVNEKVSIQVKILPITQPAGPDSTSYSWADWEGALWLENAARKDSDAMSRAADDGRVTQEQFVRSAMLSPKSFYTSLAGDLEGAVKVCASLESFLDEKCGKQSPSLVQFHQALTSVEGLVDDILKGRENEPVAQIPAALDFTEAWTSSSERHERPLTDGAQINSRAEAYQMLSVAANYLMRAEPHSPTPHLVRRAIEWGNMGLKDLLKEVIQNQQERDAVFKLLDMEDKP